MGTIVSGLMPIMVPPSIALMITSITISIRGKATITAMYISDIIIRVLTNSLIRLLLVAMRLLTSSLK